MQSTDNNKEKLRIPTLLTTYIYGTPEGLAIWKLQNAYRKHQLSSFDFAKEKVELNPKINQQARQELIKSGYINTNNKLDTVSLQCQTMLKELNQRYSAIIKEYQYNKKLWESYELRRKNNSTALVFGLTAIVCWLLYILIIAHIPFLVRFESSDAIYGFAIPVIACITVSSIYKNKKYSEKAKHGAEQKYLDYFNQQVKALKQTLN